MDKISIVIPNLNSPIIDKTIKSIFENITPHMNYEVIVVGKDKYNLIQKNKIKFIETKDILNPAQARNLGVHHSTGKIVCFTDADCITGKNWMTYLVEMLKEGYGAVGGSVTFDAANYWTLCDNITCFYFMLSDRPRGVYEGDVLGTLSFCITKDTFVEIGGFDERLVTGEDFDFGIRLRNRGYKMGFEPRAVVSHHPSRSSMESVLKHVESYANGFFDLLHKYPDLTIQTEFFASHRWLLFFSSPFKSLYFCIRLFYQHPTLRKYWYTMPGIFMIKFWLYYTLFRKNKIT
ncbi:MAG: glycosyltransferase [Deltaproteobacteria bacterium]|nr:glycosyltransferase [Deltaproteobacteria bacterium]